MTNSPQPSPQEIREELDRLLEDVTFRRAPSHSRLLRYLVERKAAGDDSALCEAGIAMAVFQRDPAAYDAEIDPIVRVSIGRLRDRLEKHYQRFDRVPDTIIMLPRGRYAPEFRHRASRAAAPLVRGLAVMDTRNLTGEARFDALAHGLSERLSEALVLMGLPRVIAPGSVRKAQSANEAPVEVGRQVGASDIVETALSLEPSQRLRISARLIRAPDGELAWAEVRTVAQDDPYQGIDALFDAVLARFSAAPGALVRQGAAPAPNRKPALPPAARSRIESARILITHMTQPGVEQARALLAAVTAEFPDAADAWALRGRSCVRRLNFGNVPALPLIAELEECARTAIAIDPDHVEARALRALVLHWTAALPEAEAQFRDVLRAAPNHTSARLGYGWLLLGQGRMDEALTAIDAAGSFDPMSLNVLFNRAYTLAVARRHEEARAVFETGLRVGGESPFGVLACARNELWAGELGRAETLLQRVGELAPDTGAAESGLACIAALRGDAGQARALQRVARSRISGGASHYADAELHALLGERTEALAALRAAVEAMDTMRLLAGVDPAFAPLAGDPEFLAVLGTLGLARWCGVAIAGDR